MYQTAINNTKTEDEFIKALIKCLYTLFIKITRIICNSRPCCLGTLSWIPIANNFSVLRTILDPPNRTQFSGHPTSSCLSISRCLSLRGEHFCRYNYQQIVLWSSNTKQYSSIGRPGLTLKTLQNNLNISWKD